MLKYVLAILLSISGLAYATDTEQLQGSVLTIDTNWQSGMSSSMNMRSNYNQNDLTKEQYIKTSFVKAQGGLFNGTNAYYQVSANATDMIICPTDSVAELVTNGDFNSWDTVNTPNGWTLVQRLASFNVVEQLPTGTLHIIANNKQIKTNASIFTSGKSYQIIVDCVVATGDFRVYRGGEDQSIKTITSTGVYPFSFKANGTSYLQFTIGKSGTTSNVYINSVSVREVQFAGEYVGTSINLGKFSTLYSPGTLDKFTVAPYTVSTTNILRYQQDYKFAELDGYPVYVWNPTTLTYACQNSCKGINNNITSTTNSGGVYYNIRRAGLGNRFKLNSASLQYLTTTSNIPFKTIVIYANIASVNESLVSFNTTQKLSIISGVVSASTLVAPTIFVDGIPTAAITIGRHAIIVTTGTNINPSNLTIGRIGDTYSDSSMYQVAMYPFSLNRTLAYSESIRLKDLYGRPDTALSSLWEQLFDSTGSLVIGSDGSSIFVLK